MNQSTTIVDFYFDHQRRFAPERLIRKIEEKMTQMASWDEFVTSIEQKELSRSAVASRLALFLEPRITTEEREWADSLAKELDDHVDACLKFKTSLHEFHNIGMQLDDALRSALSQEKWEQAITDRYRWLSEWRSFHSAMTNRQGKKHERDDHHLALLSKAIHEHTGKAHWRIITDLVNAAYEATGRDTTIDEKTIAKAVERARRKNLALKPGWMTTLQS